MMSSGFNFLAPVTLILGGARSGKSRFAEELVLTTLKPDGTAVFLATAEAGDAEMAARIARHRKRRGPVWRTVEEPLDLAVALARYTRPASPVLVDCLTLWLANVLAAGRDADREIDGLVEALADAAGPVILVSNEVGHGIIPDNALARSYADHAGLMNQRVAVAADKVVLMSAGLPQVLKDEAA
ncbi:MAG TPA: bifunctional adenosylcobinamide kinase/adenosylcobinamide-phosphate guanylyltransferase [Rhodospirillales bacterium]